MMKRIKYLITLMIIFISVISLCPENVQAYTTQKTCKASGCNRTATSNRGYCSSHTCHYGSCNAATITNSQYCYAHSNKSKRQSYDKVVREEAEKQNEFWESKKKATTCKESGCNALTKSSRGYCTKHTCAKCNAHRIEGSQYCYSHSNKNQRNSYDNKLNKNSSSSASKSSTSNKKKSSYDSYDKGYEDVWLDGDYDEDRYSRDWDYALGVDDAMDDDDWDW